jgi:hypothetical protein
MNTNQNQGNGERKPDEPRKDVPVNPVKPGDKTETPAAKESDAATELNVRPEEASLWEQFTCEFRLWNERRKVAKKTVIREKSKWTDIASVFLGIAIAGAAFYSAWIFEGQLREMHKSNSLAKMQWETEYRPWMGIDGLAVTSIKFTSRRPSLISIHLEGTMVLKNFGTYPAFSANAEITPVFPVPTEAWTKNPLGRPPKGTFMCPDQETFLPGGEVVFPTREFTHAFVNDLSWGWKGRNVEVRSVWLAVCISYFDGRQKQPHHTWIWLRSVHPLKARWIILNPTTRYMPVTGFESWGEEAN